MATKDFPVVPKGLIEALEDRFKDTVPTNANTSLDEFRLIQGRLEVVRFLRSQYEKQNRNILEY
jgi:hypothetical protein